MLYQINLANGFAQFQGVSKHLKVISAASPVKLEVVAVGNRAGRVLMSSLNVRAPMGFVLPEDAGTVNFYGADQTLEIWSGDAPLEYLQLTAVGAVRMNAKKLVAPGGISTKLANSTPRSKLQIRSNKEISIASDALAAAGWTVPANTVEVLETSGEVWAVGKNQLYNYLDLAGAHTVLSPLTNYGASYGNNAYWTFFNGFFWAKAATGGLAAKAATDGTLEQFNNGGNTVFHGFAGRLWQVSAAGAGQSALISSSDGVVFDIETMITGDAGTVAITAGLKTDVMQVGEWLNVAGSGTSAGKSIAVNMVTKEVKVSPQALTTSHRCIYWPELDKWISTKTGTSAADGVYAYEGGEWVKKITGPAGLGSSGVILADELGTLYITSGSLSHIAILKPDFTQQIIITSAGPGYWSGYIYGTGGQLFWNSNGNLSFYREGIDAGTVSVSAAAGVDAYYDAPNSRILILRTDSGQIGFNEKAAPNLPALEPAIIEVLEFLV